jgi:sugar lactone lactonase YvrE
MNDTAPHCIWPLQATLGEGPVWCADERTVYFVDIKGRQIHALQIDTGQRHSWPVAGQPGFVLPLTDGGLVCGMDTALYRFTPGAAQPLTHPLQIEPAHCGNRLNDGHADALGRLWCGTMHDGETDASGVLYRLSAPTPGPVAMDRGYVITNGPALSPDGKTLYHTDTLARTVYAFDVDEAGGLSRKRVFVQTPEPGWPDGMAVDAEGCVWLAFFGGWRIERRDPKGVLCAVVHFPCANVTKLAFAGDDLRTVYATTARKGLDAQALAQQPLAGGLFEWRSPVAGLAPTAVDHRVLD